MMKRQRSNLHLPVVLGSLFFSFSVIVLVNFSPQAVEFLDKLKQQIFHHFSWFYVLSSAVFLLFLVFLAFSRYGDIRLGNDEEHPEFSAGSWFALLFTAGMGVGIIFLGVGEPIAHFAKPLIQDQAERSALFHSIFHWSVSAWAIYGTMALAIAYFGFRYKLPLSLRSCFYPLFKQRIDGKLGDLIDIMGWCATLFGVVTTLAYSAVRINASLDSLQILPEQKGWVELILVGVFVIAIVLSVQGVAKGLRRLSQFNLWLTLGFMLLVLIFGPTSHLLSTFTENIGYYLSGLLYAGFKTYVYDTSNQEWFKNWTILYWAWWFSWAPAFGIFIARISRGRTIREFIFGVLVVPSLFFVLWFSIFGNGAIWLNNHLSAETLTEMAGNVGHLLFSFLAYLPFAQIMQWTALLIIGLFFIGTVDFGVYILNNIALKDKSQTSPLWQSITWGALLAFTTLVLFETGGIDVLHAVLLLFSLPFVAVMGLMCISLFKGVRMDYHYFHTQFNQTSQWTADNWREHLAQLLSINNEHDSEQFLKRVALPAMRELRQHLIGRYDLTVHLQTDWAIPSLSLNIEQESRVPFRYEIRLVEQQIFSPSRDQMQSSWVPMVFFNHEQSSYDVQYLTSEELILDMLYQYEKYCQQMAV